MGWIKSEDGDILVNTENIVSIAIEYEGFLPEAGIESYRVVASYIDEKSAWLLTGIKDKEEAKEILAGIERWLESGAKGIFRI